jgi:Flp pilus assembly pilin Flp
MGKSNSGAGDDVEFALGLVLLTIALIAALAALQIHVANLLGR